MKVNITKDEARLFWQQRKDIMNDWREEQKDTSINDFINFRIRNVNANHDERQNNIALKLVETKDKIATNKNAVKNNQKMRYNQDALDRESTGRKNEASVNDFERNCKYAQLYALAKDQIEKRHWYDWIIHFPRSIRQNMAMSQIKEEIDLKGVSMKMIDRINFMYSPDNSNLPGGFIVRDDGEEVYGSTEEITDEPRDLDESVRSIDISELEEDENQKEDIVEFDNTESKTEEMNLEREN